MEPAQPQAPGRRRPARVLAFAGALATIAVLAVAFGSTLAGDASIPASSEGEPTTEQRPSGGDGLVTVTSRLPFNRVVSRARAAVEASGATIVAVVDHSAGARSVGQDLRPTTVIIFGNPRSGTPLLQARQTIGIDLPQKLLIWEDARGRTRVTHNDPRYLAERHDITGRDTALRMAAAGLRMLSKKAAGRAQ